jgi:triosephosphate isomerase
MIKEAGAKFVILGHSERRRLFHEGNALINHKLKRALEHHLHAILCIGETQQERDERRTSQVLFKQLEEGLKDIDSKQLENIAIAYEPVWAIGTGKTATPEMAQEAHQECRRFIEENWGAEAAKKIHILYGGSVKTETISAQMAQSDIDGALIGAASLDPQTFANIVNQI